MHIRILKMIATSDFLTALNCTKFVFGHGSALDPAGELTALFWSQRSSGLSGPTSKGEEGRGGKGKGGKGGKEGMGRIRERRGCTNEPSHFSERSDVSGNNSSCARNSISSTFK